jgi:alpha-beta hydrolase superfamily lysophospholipase
VSLTYDEFKYAFANELDDAEARKLYDTYTIPAPGRPLFEAATASFNPYAQTQVNTHNETRGPLLLISGAADHTVPPLLVKATHKLYKKSPAVTDIQSFAGRGHSLTIDHGWQEVATFISDWIDAKVE